MQIAAFQALPVVVQLQQCDLKAFEPQRSCILMKCLYQEAQDTFIVSWFSMSTHASAPQTLSARVTPTIKVNADLQVGDHVWWNWTGLGANLFVYCPGELLTSQISPISK